MSESGSYALTAHELWLLDMLAYVNFDLDPDVHKTLGDLVDDLCANNYKNLFLANNERIYYELDIIDAPSTREYSAILKNDNWADNFVAGGALTKEEVAAALNTIAANDTLRSLELVDAQEYGRGNRILSLYDGANQEMIFAMRGTGAGQWPDNWHTIWENSSTQQRIALADVQEIIANWDKDVTSISFTGHSKGGNGATYCALELGYLLRDSVAVRCIPFDSQGPSSTYLSAYANRDKIDYYLSNPDNYQINLDNDFVNVLSGLHFNGQTGEITGFGTQYWLHNSDLSSIDWRQHSPASLGVYTNGPHMLNIKMEYGENSETYLECLRLTGYEDFFVGTGPNGELPQNSSPGYIGYLAAAVASNASNMRLTGTPEEKAFITKLAYGAMSVLGTYTGDPSKSVAGSDQYYMETEDFLAFLAEDDNLDQALLLIARSVQETYAVALARDEEAEFWKSLDMMELGPFYIDIVADKYVPIIMEILLDLDLDPPPDDVRYAVFCELYERSGFIVDTVLTFNSPELFDWAAMAERYWDDFYYDLYAGWMQNSPEDQHDRLKNEYSLQTGKPWPDDPITSTGAAAVAISTGIANMASTMPAYSPSAASTGLKSSAASLPQTYSSTVAAAGNLSGSTLHIGSNTVADIIAGLKTADRRLGTLEGDIISLRSAVNAELDRLSRKRSTGEVRAERRELNTIKSACDDALRDLSDLPLLQMANIIENNVQNLFDLDAGHSRQATVIRI